MDTGITSALTREAQALERHDRILSALTQAAEVFLRGSLATWQENVLQVISQLGMSLGANRIFLCKHKEVTGEYVVTAMRYEWQREGNQVKVDIPEWQDIHMQASGFGRWAGLLYEGEMVSGRRSELAENERGGFLSPNWGTLITVPVFVEREWWGFIVFEDYPIEGELSPAEIQAFKTVAVTFGAAIRRKRMEESLVREQRAVREKAEQIEDLARFPSEDPWPIMRILGDGRLTYANRAAKGLMVRWQIQINETAPEDWVKLVKEVLHEDKPRSTDTEIDGRTYLLLLVPITRAGYVNIYGHDVTRERELSRLKSEFLAIASHQLRSPLTSMRWYSERLLEKGQGMSPELVEMAQVIHECAVNLSKLVNDLLSVSRIERGKIEPVPTLNNLNSVIGDVVRELKGQAAERGVTFKVEADEAVGPFWFDGELIRQAVTNLANNAVKYSREGGTVTLRSFWFDLRYAGLEVADDGIGIPLDEQPKIFERFYRAKNAKTADNQGTGLGLSLVKMIAEKSGGRVWFDSTENKGTTFTLILPFNRELGKAVI